MSQTITDRSVSLEELESALQSRIGDGQLLLDSTVLSPSEGEPVRVEGLENLLASLNVSALAVESPRVDRSDEGLTLTGTSSLPGIQDINITVNARSSDNRLAFGFEGQMPGGLDLPGGDWIGLEDVGLSLHSGSTNGVTGELRGSVRVGSVRVPVSMVIPATYEGLVLKGNFESVTLPGLADLAGLFGGSDPVEALPAELVSAVSGLSIRQVQIALNPNTHSVTSVSVVVRSEADWEVVPGHVSVRDVELSLSVFHPADTRFRSVAAVVSGTIRIGSQNILIAISIPGERSGLTIRLGSMESLRLPSFSDLAALAGGDPIAGLPEGLELSTFEISDLEIGFHPARKALTHVSVSVHADRRWEIIPGQLSVQDIRFDLTIGDPLDASRRDLSGAIEGTVKIGSLDLPILVSCPGGSAAWTLKLNLDEPIELPSLADLLSFAGGAGFGGELLDGLDGLGAVSLSDLEVAFDPASKGVSRVGVSVSSSAHWSPRDFSALSVRNIRLDLAILEPASSGRRVTGRLTGDARIGSAEFSIVTENLDGEAWTIYGSPISGGALDFTQIGSDLAPGLPSLPAELPSFRFSNVAFSSVPAAGVFSLQAESATTWRIPVGSGGLSISDIDLTSSVAKDSCADRYPES